MHQQRHTTIIFLLLWEVIISYQSRCPRRFQEIRLKETNNTICIQRRGPSTFPHFFEDCSYNLFSSRLFNDLDIENIDIIWSEYKSSLPEGIHLAINSDEDFGENEELCIVVVPNGNLTIAKCDEKHYWYCLVKPYLEDIHFNISDNKLDFWSPQPISLLRTSVSSEDISEHIFKCNEQGGTIMFCDDFQYSVLEIYIKCHHKTLVAIDKDVEFISKNQVGIFSFSSGQLHEYDKPQGYVFNTKQNIWILYKMITLKSVTLNITLKENNLVLFINDTSVKEENLKCYTDSNSYYATPVTFQQREGLKEYVVTQISDGYYWCEHLNEQGFKNSISNKFLRITDENGLKNRFALKIQAIERFDLNKVDIFNDTVYNIVELISKSKLIDFRAKKIYLDGRTALYHIKLESVDDTNQLKLKKREWNGTELIDMKPIFYFLKPVFYCPEFGSVPSTPLGRTAAIRNDKIKCIGDFNEGVQWDKDSPDMHFVDLINNLTRINSNDKVTKRDAEAMMSQVNKLIESQEHIEIPEDTSLHLLLDQMASKIEPKLDSNVTVIAENKIALVVAKSSPDKPIRGLLIESSNDGKIKNSDIKIMYGPINSSTNEHNVNDVYVSLPKFMASNNHNLTVFINKNDYFFKQTNNENQYKVKSTIIGINMGNVTHFPNGETIDIYFNPIKSDNCGRKFESACAYWKFRENNSGSWSTYGCTLNKSSGSMDLCSCNHLTNFAEVIVPRTTLSDTHELILELISIIGCVMSIFGLIMVGITAAMFKTWRNSFNNKIWIQLSAALLLVVVSFLLEVFVNLEVHKVVCMLSGIVLHYGVLASLCWMLVATIQAYRKTVIVLPKDPSHKLLRASVFSWGVPCLVIFILLSVDWGSYSGCFKEKAQGGHGYFCYPSGLSLWISVYTPVALLLLLNLIQFLNITYVVFVANRNRVTMFSYTLRKRNPPTGVFQSAVMSCTLAFLLGLPWIFGLFASNTLLAYLFTSIAAFQGFLLFIFVVFKRETRKLWLPKIGYKNKPTDRRNREQLVVSFSNSNRM